MQDESKPGMQCVEFEALLADALDTTLPGTIVAAFKAHQQECKACAEMYEQAAAGMHWLKGLEDIEPPKHLVHNILAQTIGSVAETSIQAPPAGGSLLEKMKARIASVFAPVMTPRFAMSFGMAFFSITMLANVAGIHASDLRRMDLSAKGLQRTYYSTEARVVRYYENIRLVYEIESRVRDLRRAATPEKQEETTPKSPSNNKKSGAQEQDRKYQNYSRDVSQPVLASCPAVDKQEIQQARLNRRTA